MANNQDVTNNRNSFNANNNADYTVETVDQGSGVHRQVVSIGDGTVDTITGITNPVSIQFSDSPSIDAFARARVSNPTTIFDSKQIFDNQPLFWDDSEVSGGSTTSSHSTNTASTTIGVALNTAGKRVRQTFMRFNYQPGKSQLILLTGTLKSGGGTGITRCMGLYDDDNGIFFKDDEGTIKAVRRSNYTGTPVDTEISQSNFNLDPLDGTGASGITLDPDQSQIAIFDLEWLGVGRVRMGFVFNGIPVYCHQFTHSNQAAGVYMSTPNLPLRYEIENDGTGAASTLEHICCSVMSEGGLQELGVLRYKSTEGTEVVTNAENSIFAIVGIRLKSASVAATVLIEKIALQVQSASENGEWLLIFNPTVNDTFTYSGETNSAIETATGATANTVTGGTIITGGYVFSTSGGGGAGGTEAEVSNALRLGAAIDGTVDEIVLCYRPIGGTSAANIEGSITWRELS